MTISKNKLITQKKLFFLLLPIVLFLLIVGGGYKIYLNKKELRQKEARFDHFMNYWYPIIEKNHYDIGLYARMKKGLILDYIKYNRRYTVDDFIPLFGGGYFSIHDFVKIDRELGSTSLGQMAADPITFAPNFNLHTRLKEREAFWNFFMRIDNLRSISIFEEEYENIENLKAVFEEIDSIEFKIHTHFIFLEKYKVTQIKGSDRNTLNNIPLSEYSLENY